MDDGVGRALPLHHHLLSIVHRLPSGNRPSSIVCQTLGFLYIGLGTTRIGTGRSRTVTSSSVPGSCRPACTQPMPMYLSRVGPYEPLVTSPTCAPFCVMG